MQVRIYKPAKSVMQSGTANDYWVLEPLPNDTGKFLESLMGRTSSKNMNNEVSIKFSNLREAISFAERQHYQYDVMIPQQKKLIKKTYASNFQ